MGGGGKRLRWAVFLMIKVGNHNGFVSTWPKLFSREAEFFIPAIILGKGCWGGFPGGVGKLMRVFSYVNTYTLFRHGKNISYKIKI